MSEFVTPDICDLKHEQLMRAIEENTMETKAIAKLLRGNGAIGIIERTSLIEQRVKGLEQVIERTSTRAWALVMKVLPYVISLGAIGTAVAAIQSSPQSLQPIPGPVQHTTP